MDRPAAMLKQPTIRSTANLLKINVANAVPSRCPISGPTAYLSLTGLL